MKYKIKKDCEFRGVPYEKGKSYELGPKEYRVLKSWKAIAEPKKASKSKEAQEEQAPSLDN
tara:strand:+ start:468 stop:650 length:183 start_codon:yes stop_codon:yes gene_type:complete